MAGPEAHDETQIPFPVEFVINDTPISAQTDNSAAKERWKQKVRAYAVTRLKEVRDWYCYDERPLSATIYYFPPDKMQGDIDNIVKPILDGMTTVVYPDDSHIERVVVQKFEPGVVWSFEKVSPKLGEALDAQRPVVYVRIDDDLRWRAVP